MKNRYRPVMWMVLTLASCGALSGAPALKDVAPWRQGMEALDAELWEVADKRFEDALATPGLTPADRRRVEWKRIESWIRGNLAAKALARLAEPAFATDPETYFWKGQALAGLGRYAEAVEAFAPAVGNTKAVFRGEALLTRASLQTALGDQDGAAATLDALAKGADARVARQARLRNTAILLDQGKIPEARALLKSIKTQDPAETAEQAFLDARLLLAEGQADAAVSSFAVLKDKAAEGGGSRARYHALVLGMADALAASGNKDQALDLLLSEVQKQKDSPVLGPVFERVLRWLPEEPAPNDPVLERLKPWLPAPDPGVLDLIAGPSEADPAKDRSGAADARPAIPAKEEAKAKEEELAVQSLFARAIGLHRVGTPDARHEADALMNRLRLEYPGHPLVPRALLETGRWRLEEKQPDAAFAALNAVLQMNAPAALRGEAAFIEARAEFDRGNPDAAAALFDQASTLLPDRAAEAAALNLALVRLRGGPLAAIPRGGAGALEEKIRPDLELERALALIPPAARCAALQDFLSDHPGHAREGEARLAAATAALRMHPADAEFAKVQQGIVEASPALLAEVTPERLAWLKLEIADQGPDPMAAVLTARDYREKFKDGPNFPQATLILGRNLFRNGDYHTARLELEKLAAAAPDARISQAALVLAARAAALGATDQSREEALALFAKLVAGNGPVAPLARLERASLLNELGRLDTTIAELKPWFDSLKPGDALRVPAGLLLGDALYAQGATKPASLPAALDIYDQLLSEAKDDRNLVNRLQYQRGMTLERLPGSEGPGTTRAAGALDCYVSVLQSGDDHPPTEWKWFENCGFRALKLLEDAGKWTSAMKIAEKIASFGGPRAAEAADRARNIRMDQMLYED